jgi:hypothetical protein
MNEPDNARIFSQMAMSRALRKLGYITKITLTVASQAFSMRHLARCQMFWTEPWPIGIHCVPQSRLIDADKFGMHLNVANKKYGLSLHGLEIRKPENYGRGDFLMESLQASLSSYNSWSKPQSPLLEKSWLTTSLEMRTQVKSPST